MATPEKPRMEVTESMSAAERRVNSSKEDIPGEQKVKIAALERNIRDFMRDPKYAELKDSYKRDLGNYDNSPESVLGTIKYHFDRMVSIESEASGEALRSISALAIFKLEGVKHDLGLASEIQEDHDRSYAATISQMTGADRPLAEAPELPENMDAIESMLGVTPRQKLETNAALNEEKLMELKRPEHASDYIQASVMYKSITGGAQLEDANKMLSDALSKGVEAAQSLEPTAMRRALMDLVAKQLKAMEGLSKLLSMKDRPPMPPVENHEEEKSSFTDAQMAEILDHIMAEVRWDRVEASKPVHVPNTISEGLETYYKVGPAYEFYTGRGPEDLNIGEAEVLGGLQGAVSGLVAFDQLAIGAVSWVGEKAGLVHSEEKSGETHHAESLTAKLLSAGKSILDPHTWEMGWQMLQYGFENTSSAEKVFMLNKMVTEFVVAGALAGEVLSALKLGKFAAGGKVGLELMSGAMEAIATTYPALSKYGFTAERVVVGLEHAAHTATHLWDHSVLHGAHIAENVHGVEASFYHPTVGTYSHAKEEVIHKEHSFEYDEMKQIAQDIRLALKGSEVLGMNDEQLSELRHAKSELDTRIASVEHHG